MRRNFKHLTKVKRLQLESYLKINMSKKEIAKLLGVHISTVYREIKKGSYEHLLTDLTYETRYSCDKAEEYYQENLKAKGQPLKIGNDHELAAYIEDRIVNGRLSPKAVLGEIKHKNLKFNTSICVNTLYSYIYKDVFSKLTMENLVMKEKKKRYKRVVQKKAPKGTSIEDRPKEIDDRSSFGHWEMDCVCGSTLPTLLVLTERQTRKEIIRWMPNQKAESVLKELNKIEKEYGCKQFKEIFKTISVDNGSEFADFIGLEKSIYTKMSRTKVYYCHAYCSWEKGCCERLNREIRRLIPKGSDIGKYSKDEIKAVEDWVNRYPREILEFATSEELFIQAIIKQKQSQTSDPAFR